MTVAGSKIGERHLESPTDFHIHVMNLAGEAVGWQPLGDGVSFQKGAIDALGIRLEYAVKSDSACSHDQFPFDA